MNECDHYYRDIGNHWFHWNTGEVMCIGECVKCGIKKDIHYSIIKNQKKRDGSEAKRMNEKHKCCNCEEQISLFRAFCSKDCEEAFYTKYPQGA